MVSPGPGSDRRKCARRSPASARRRRRNPSRSTPSTPTRHPLEKERTHRRQQTSLSQRARGIRADSRTHVPVDGWCPERRRTARKEPPFWSMWRAGRCPLPLRCLPTRRDQRGIPIWLSWACGFQLWRARDPTGGSRGRRWLGGTGSTRLGAAAFFSYLPSRWRPFDWQLLLWRFWVGFGCGCR
jgi:hypothetical protein